MKPRVFLPAILTGPLLWAAFFPLDLGPLAFVALVPWLLLVRAPCSGSRQTSEAATNKDGTLASSATRLYAPVSGKRLYFAGYVGGLSKAFILGMLAAEDAAKVTASA